MAEVEVRLIQEARALSPSASSAGAATELLQEGALVDLEHVEPEVPVLEVPPDRHDAPWVDWLVLRVEH